MRRMALSAVAVHVAARIVDFYITKYQGKPMESLTPMFQAMQGGIRRLELQEQEEETAAAEKQAQGTDAPSDVGAPQAISETPAQKRHRRLEALARRARRVTVRLASMANR